MADGTKLSFNLLSRRKYKSNYDNFNIEYGRTRVGKVRGLIDGNTLTIFSMLIFSEFKGHGFGTETIEMFKVFYETIIADRVRPAATGFWIKMGFDEAEDGSYVFQRM